MVARISEWKQGREIGVGTLSIYLQENHTDEMECRQIGGIFKPQSFQSGYNHRMQILVIGDIHGCYDEFQSLLDKAGLTEDDSIISVGDAVDRGPNTPAVLRFLQEKPNALLIMGNHERKWELTVKFVRVNSKFPQLNLLHHRIRYCSRRSFLCNTNPSAVSLEGPTGLRAEFSSDPVKPSRMPASVLSRSTQQ
jgi:hypothetical protein